MEEAAGVGDGVEPQHVAPQGHRAGDPRVDERGALVVAVPTVEEIPDRLGLLPGDRLGETGDESRHHHIFQGIEFGQQMVKLKHKPHLAIAKGCQRPVIQREDVFALPVYLAGAGAFQCPQDVKQGGFS